MRGTKNRGRVTTSKRKIRVSVKQPDAASAHGASRLKVPSDAPDWSRFPGTTPLQAWARELREACSSNGAVDPWELTGRAAMVIGEDEPFCAAVLRRVAAEAGMRLVTVAADDVPGLLSAEERDLAGEDVVEFAPPAEWRRSAPLMVHLQRGRWMQAKQDDDNDGVVAGNLHLQSRLASWIRAFDRERPVVIVTSADDITAMVESLRQVGLFDRFLRLPSLTMEARGEDFIERIGRSRCGESITQSAGKVGKLVSSEYEGDRRVGLAALRLRRLVASEERQLEFIDIVNLAAHGFSEADAPPMDPEGARRQCAYHEAGHAVVAVIDSGGRNVPEYSSIVPSAHFKGVVMPSWKYLLDAGDLFTYADLRHKVRISLAGRAAEELVYGAERVSNGASEDLKSATERAGTAIALWGFAPSMEKEGQAGSNLAIVPGDGETITETEHAHVERLVREFLAVEYERVKEMLAAHRQLMDAVADRLMVDPIVDQETLAALVRAHMPGLEGSSAAARADSADGDLVVSRSTTEGGKSEFPKPRRKTSVSL